MSYLASRPEQSTSSEAGLLTVLNNLPVGGPGTAIEKTGTNSFANVPLIPNLPSIVTIMDSSVIQVNTDLGNMFIQSNSASATTIPNPLGTPTEGQRFILRVKSNKTQALSFGSMFVGSSDFGLPAGFTGGGKTDYLGFIFNAINSKWEMVAKVFGF